jgi:hypothetical protein
MVTSTTMPKWLTKWQLTPGLTQSYSAQVSTDIKGICGGRFNGKMRLSMGKCGFQIIRNHHTLWLCQQKAIENRHL